MIGSSPLLPRLRNKLRRQRSKSKPSEGSSSTLSLRISLSSCESSPISGAEYEDAKAQCDKLVILKVFVPDGKGPGQKVKVCGPDGRKVRTVVPPRSHWQFENRDGTPRPFFLIRSVGPAAPRAAEPLSIEAVHPAPPRSTEPSSIEAVRPAAAGRSTEPRRRAPLPNQRSSADEGRRASFRDAPRTVCRCVPSEGVFDSFCPVHGTDAPPRRGRTRPRGRDDDPEAAPPIDDDDEEELVRRASRAAFRDERRRRRAAEEKYASELERALKDSERLEAEEDRVLRSEEELVQLALGNSLADLGAEEELVRTALWNSLADFSHPEFLPSST